MIKLLSITAFVTLCFAVDAAAQVPVPPPIQVPRPVDSSHITISREILRIEAKRAGKKNSGRPKSDNVAKPPNSKAPVGTPPSSADLARRMPDVYGPFLVNISRVGLLQKNDQLSSTSGSERQRSVGQKPTTQPAGDLAAHDTTFLASQPPFVPQQLAARIAKTPQERQYLEGVLTKCLNFYIDTAKQKRVPLNDVALALNYFISTNYFVHSSGAGPTPQQMNATRDLIRANLRRDNTFRSMSDKQKQEVYETLIVLAGFVDLGAGRAKQSGDAATAGQFREMAKYNLETLLGAPIAKIHFTNGGLAIN